jgi:hypothetical protein
VPARPERPASGALWRLWPGDRPDRRGVSPGRAAGTVCVNFQTEHAADVAGHNQICISARAWNSDSVPEPEAIK